MYKDEIISRKQNLGVLSGLKKMENLNSWKLEEKALPPSFVKATPKVVTRLLRNRVVLEDIESGKELQDNVPKTIQKEMSPIDEKSKETAEWKILDLALANKVPMDVILRNVLAFSPIVKIERQILVPHRSKRTSSPTTLETIDISTDEEDTTRRGISVDKENSSLNYVLSSEDEQEKRIKRRGPHNKHIPSKETADMENCFENNSYVTTLEKQLIGTQKTGMVVELRKDLKKAKQCPENGLIINSVEEKSQPRKKSKGMSVDEENSSLNYNLLLEEEQERRIERWVSTDIMMNNDSLSKIDQHSKHILPKKTEDVDNLAKSSYLTILEKKQVRPKKVGMVVEVRKDLIKARQDSEYGLTITPLKDKSYPRRKTKGTSSHNELVSQENSLLYSEETEIEPDKESTKSLERESKISIKEDELPVNIHNGRKYCDFCNVGYTNYFLLEKHKKICKLNPVNVKTFPRKIFYCRYCYFGITNKEYFNLHESRCHNEQKNVNKPKKRLKKTSFEEPSKFKSKRSKTGKNKCPHCDYTSDNLGHLNQHVRIHSNVPLCICEICDKGFNRISSLRIHMFKHLNLAEEITLVESLEILEESAKKIVMHVKLNGRNIEIVKYECNKCEFVTTVLFSLEMHMNTMHLKRIVFKCNICPFTSMVKANLRQHLNLHTRERTYKCRKCPYESLNRTYLKKHDNQVHTKAKVFQCSSCEFKCYRQENLNCHVNSMHSKKKRFDCKFCRYFSYYQSNLIGHVKNIHQDINIKKPV